MNNSLILQEEIGGIEYLLKNAFLVFPYLILYCIGAVVGFIGNVLIMVAILVTKEMHNPTNMLIFNLSIADLLISTIVDVFTILGILLGKSFFEANHLLCVFISSICILSCLTSIFSIGFLGFNRYLNICHHQLYTRVFTRNKTLLYCLFAWCVGLMYDLPLHLGWSRHYYSNNHLACFWDRTASHSYALLLPIAGIITPEVATFIFYLKIYLFVRNSEKKSNSPIKKQIRIAKGLFASFMLFALSWLPHGLVTLTDWHHIYPAPFDMYPTLLGHLNSAANPILYGIFNPSFRKAYANVFNLVTRRKMQPVTNQMDLSTLKSNQRKF